MFGTIVGDVAGSRFEWHNLKSKKFDLFSKDCRFTDDTVMSAAIAKALMQAKEDFSDLEEKTVKYMQEIGRKYPKCGFGGKFRLWVASDDPQPYGSYGNGSAMRVGPCGWVAKTIEEAKMLSEKVTKTTHNHPEGMKGAEAVAVAIFLARNGKSKDEIKKYIASNYYPMDFKLDEIRKDYHFDSSCQGSVPQAIKAFLEGENFEDVIRSAISIGGDSDTIAAIAGSIAEAYYGVPERLKEQTSKYLTKDLLLIINEFENKYCISNESLI